MTGSIPDFKQQLSQNTSIWIVAYFTVWANIRFKNSKTTNYNSLTLTTSYEDLLKSS